MKRYLPIFAVLAIAGCSHEVTVPGGTVTTDSKGQMSKVETKDGSVEVKGNTVIAKGADGSTMESNTSVSEADLSVPFYAGSTEMPGSIKITDKEKSVISSIRTTPDACKKVIDFYLDKIGPSTHTTNMDKMATGVWKKDGKDISVIASTEDGKTTTITVAVSTNSKP